MTKVKICGIRRKEDIEYVNELLPDYIGYVFAESKRKVTLELVEELSEMLNKRIRKVGVFVNEKIKNIVDTVEKCSLDCVQIHGNEDINYLTELKKIFTNQGCATEIWKALRVDSFSAKTENLLDEKKFHFIHGTSNESITLEDIVNKYTDIANAILLDKYDANVYGGSGETFDWEIVKKIKNITTKIVLAGGLNSDNVLRAIKISNPYIVDVSSGVETDGVKDKEKIKEFIKLVRESGY